MTLYFKDNAVNLLVARGKKVDRWVSSLAPGLVVGGVIKDEAGVAAKVRDIFSGLKTPGE